MSPKRDKLISRDIEKLFQQRLDLDNLDRKIGKRSYLVSK